MPDLVQSGAKTSAIVCRWYNCVYPRFYAATGRKQPVIFNVDVYDCAIEWAASFQSPREFAQNNDCVLLAWTTGGWGGV